MTTNITVTVPKGVSWKAVLHFETCKWDIENNRQGDEWIAHAQMPEVTVLPGASYTAYITATQRISRIEEVLLSDEEKLSLNSA